MCSHPRTGDATDEKIAEKNREKFNELNFLRQNHGLRQRVATQAIFAARWRRDNFKKSHHHRKQKIARVAAALILVLPWLFDNTDSNFEYRFFYPSNDHVIYSSGRSLKRKCEFLFEREEPNQNEQETFNQSLVRF